MLMLVLVLSLVSPCLAVLEPYSHACYQLATTLEWDCDFEDPFRQKECLCKEPEFDYLTRMCLQEALKNTTLTPQVCPKLLEYKSIISNIFSASQITDAVALTAASQSLDATSLNRSRADRYSNGVFFYWVVIMALFTAANLWLWLHPRSYMSCGSLRAMKFFRKHLQFSPIPSLELLIMLGFVGIEICIMLVNIPLVHTHVSLPLYTQQILKHVADRNGYMGAKLIPLVVYLGGRNGFLMTLTGWTPDRINILHRWLGRVVVVNFVLHGLCYFFIKLSLGTYCSAMRTPTFQLGTAALLVLIILGVQSLRVLRRYYELFVTLHIFFWISVLIIGYLHTRSWGSQCFLAALGLWAIDHLMRLLKIMLNGSLQKVIVSVHSNQVVQLLVPITDHEDHCGTFAFVHFVNLGWLQSHPFSYYCDGEHMRFFIRPRRGLTASIDRLALYKSPKVMIDGPYGTRPNLDCFDSVLFVVAGIGITSTIGYLRSLARSRPTKSVYLHWAVRSLVDLEFASSVLQYMPGNTLVTIYLSSTRKLSSVESLNDSVDNVDYLSQLHYCLLKSRMCVGEVVSSSLHSEKPSSVAVVVCGPDSMQAEARGAIYNSLDDCKNYVELYDHKYSW